MRKLVLQLILSIVVGLSTFSSSCAQDGQHATNAKDHFPYGFDNFVWWNDGDLRTELQKRIPTLKEEIELGSSVESRVRTVLVQLLREKGIKLRSK